MDSLYLDTCIYLNLWKKEEGFWRDAKRLFDFAMQNGVKIFYSGFVLKELLFLLSTEEYLEKRDFFDFDNVFCKVMLSRNEYIEAQKIKNRVASGCSLFDVIHVLLARKTNSILVTCDKELLELSRQLCVRCESPKDIIMN